MGWLEKMRSKVLGASAEPTAEELNESRIRPALRFTNHRHPEGPHVIVFDALRQAAEGNLVFILNLEGTNGSAEAQERLLLALDAIQQNEDAHCDVLLKEADLAEFAPFIEAVQTSHRAALARVQFAHGGAMAGNSESDLLDEQMAEVADFFAGRHVGQRDVLLADRLDRARLDFSVASLHAVDGWLGHLRAAGVDANTAEAAESMMWAGAYLGEVIRMCAKRRYRWMRYADFMTTQPADVRRMFPKAFGTQFILASERMAFTLPVNKVGRWLEEGPENNLHFYASAECARE